MTDMKKCPYCGEEIKAGAIKCKHCQTMLSEEDSVPVGAAATAKPQQTTPKVKKPIWKRWWLWVIVGLLVIAMISGGNGNDEEVADEPGEQVEEIEEVIGSPEEFVLSVVGEKTNIEGWQDPIEANLVDGEVMDLYLVGKDGFNVKRNILNHSAEIYEKVFVLYPEINSVYIKWSFPFADINGNEGLVIVMTMNMSRETEAKINWENFNTENLPKVVDGFAEPGKNLNY